MKTSIIYPVLFFILFALPIVAQDRTTINATSSEISDNLDLRAIASIFGDARDLEDFERQLNDPKIQISNLDLNDDNQVDYLRVIESVDGNAHLIVVQAVLGRDIYQDVATIEVEKDRNNQVQVQVVGDVYMYGHNYIYEPVYVGTPVIYSTFWIPTYRPYCSMWYWNYYPTFYYAWTPCPVFRYRNNIGLHINFNHHYNYVNYRSCHRAVALYEGRRSNYCERTAPNRGFAYRNNNVKNRYELDRTRTVKNLSTRNDVAYTSRNENRKNDYSSREIKTTRNNSYDIKATPIRNSNSTRNNEQERSNSFSTSSNSTSTRNNEQERSNSYTKSRNSIRNTTPIKSNESIRNNTSSDNRNSRSTMGSITKRNPETRIENSYQNTGSKDNFTKENKRSEASQYKREANSRSGKAERQNNAYTSRRG
ncbi:MAG: hypothetical protein IPN80_04945 [Flavobacterium sp.]|nr:hypothetical protein [Flavobacterium sp.]